MGFILLYIYRSMAFTTVYGSELPEFESVNNVYKRIGRYLILNREGIKNRSIKT